MMAADKRRLRKEGRVWLDRQGSPIEVSDHAWQKRDRRIALSRREQAMLDEVRQIYSGRVLIGNDLDVL